MWDSIARVRTAGRPKTGSLLEKKVLVASETGEVLSAERAFISVCMQACIQAASRANACLLQCTSPITMQILEKDGVGGPRQARELWLEHRQRRMSTIPSARHESASSVS